MPAHARGKTVSVKLVSALRDETPTCNLRGGFVSLNRGGLDSEAASWPEKTRCTEDVTSGPQQRQRPRERRALNHQVKGGYVLMAKSKAIKPQGGRRPPQRVSVTYTGELLMAHFKN